MNYELSTTEGGSSGCPQFDQNHRIVGQLHGGPASCTNVSSDFYGKFSKSWENGTTAASRLKDWLDPNNSGITALDGMDPSCNKLNVNLPWKKNLDTVAHLPHLWKIRNPNGDSTFRLAPGGYENLSGKAFRIVAEESNPIGRGDSLLVSPLGVSRYKNLRIQFRHAYRRINTQDSDTLQVMVSRDCGSSFRKIASFSGAGLVSDQSTGVGFAFTPADTSQWIFNSLSLDSTYNRAEQLVIGFGFTSGNAGTLWLDQIELSGDTARSLPIARFEANETGGCAGISIQFSDSSLNNPTGRTWLFEGGNPSTSTDANPTVLYANPGNFKVRLVVSNEEGSDTLEKESHILIQSIGAEETPFLQDYANVAAAFPGTGYVLLNPQNNISWQLNNTVNAPGSQGGSLYFDNWSNPDVTGEKDLLVFPKILTAGKQHLKVRLKYAYKFYQNFGGTASPDTLRIGRATDCGLQFSQFWKKGGQELATAGSATSSYTPAAGDWKTISLNLDSLLIYPEVAIAFENTFGYGNRIFIDDISIDTTDSCPSAPMVQASGDSLCSGQTLVLSMDSVANATYSWSGPGNYSSGSRVSTRVVTLTSAGTYQASVTVNGCTSEQSSISIAVSPQPGVPTITQTGNTLFGPPGFSYTWILNGDTLPDQTQSITAPESGTYILVVFNPFGCSRNSQPKVVTVTGVNRLQTALVQAFPNPAGDVLHISLKGNSITGVELRNSIGQLIRPEVMPVEGSEYDLNMQGLAGGNYWLIIRTQNGFQRISVIKNQ
jgi:PKD repeat protein